MARVIALRMTAPLRAPLRDAPAATGAIDCSRLVPSPLDVSPIRSPQAVHTVLARAFSGKRLIEIGTRRGDGMACFAHAAASALAIEPDKQACAALRSRSAAITGPIAERAVVGGRRGSFGVSCARYQSKRGTPDADFYTWWQQVPHLVNHDVLHTLGTRLREGAIRSTAVAVPIFDMSWPADKRSWATLRAYAAWNASVPYDESVLCKRQRTKGCGRAKGEFMVAAIELRQLPMNRTLLRPTRRIAARARAQPGRHSSALPLPMGVRRVEAWAPRSAVCLTGLQRSFPEIGGSIKEAVDYLLPPRAREIFGVRPADDPWDAVQRLLPMQSLVTQAPCHHNLSLSLRSYYFCHQHGRKRAKGPGCAVAEGGELTVSAEHCGCMQSMVQELCDLQVCARLLREREAEVGRHFEVVLRLRADLFWETRIALPSPVPPRTLFVPWLEPNSGYNDHVAFGDRQTMQTYLTRGELLGDEAVWGDNRPLPYVYGGGLPLRGPATRSGRPRVTSEQFLRAVLHRAGVRVVPLKLWAYCLFSRKSLLDQRGVYGCIARTRTRTRCSSLVCAHSNQKYWCNCWNASCAALELGRPAAKLGPFEAEGAVPLQKAWQLQRALRRDRRTADATGVTAATRCIDLNASTQLLLRAGGMGDTACPWTWSEGELFSRQYRYRFVERHRNCSSLRVIAGL
jgi:hypothetical protein